MLRQYELIERVKAYDPGADEALVNRAYVYSVQAHGTQTRASGDPYFSHPVEVAGILTELRLDTATIVTAILHDTVEDTGATHAEIAALFGEEVARLVDGVTKLTKLEGGSASDRAADNLRKFLLAISDDIRVLLVKLADRLHNMRTLHFVPVEEKRRRIARETLDIYAPLAERIGLYEWMRELEELAFRETEPAAHESITRRRDALKAEGRLEVERLAGTLQQLLAESGLSARVSGREKSPYSIWRKMAERHVAFEQLSDIMAFRVVCETTADCYRALGLIHARFPAVPDRFKDYISTPKRNGYRSIHTTVIQAGVRIEVQIRSVEMDRQAEFGLAAHWAYKTGDARPDGQVGWLRDLMEIAKSSGSAEELLEHTRMAMYQDRIFAFSPKGDLQALPTGATALDFAYAVHTELGGHAVGAKINGQTVPLRSPIANGDQVEVLTSDGQTPQPAWLSFVVTGKARAAIRRTVKQQQQGQLVAMGEKLLSQIAGRLPSPIKPDAIADAARRLGLGSEDDLRVAVARRELDDRTVLDALMPGKRRVSPQRAERPGQPVSIDGLTPGMAYALADCCTPIPGDRIVGVRRADRPLTVHTIDCPVLSESGDCDWVDLTWDGRSGGSSRLEVTLKNEPGALAAMAGVFAHAGANILNLRLTTRDTRFHSFDVTLEVRDLAHLMRILIALRAAEPVVRADRHQSSEIEGPGSLAAAE